MVVDFCNDEMRDGLQERGREDRELFPPLHSNIVMVAGDNHTVAEDGGGPMDTKTV